MSSNGTNSSLRDLAGHLHRSFVANLWAHAEQLPDGDYCTLYKPLDKAKIETLLINGDSCLTYQLASGGLRWVCFDVDIKSEILFQKDYVRVEKEAQMEVVKVVSLLSSYLTRNRIPYLLEFSGNRGAHVWVLWKEFVDQRSGYALIQKILEGSEALKSCILTAIDKFPQTPQSKGLLGKGVKLPLSRHRKSGFHSCLVSRPQDLILHFGTPVTELNEAVVMEQAQMLDSFVVPTWSEISDRLDLDEQQVEEIVSSQPYTRQAIQLLPGQVPTLDTVLNNLADCTLLSPLMAKCLEAEPLSERERAILVGLLRRIEFPGKLDFGKELLFELFSRQPNFKPNVTKAKLSNLNLYPPTCSYLSHAFGLNHGACEAHAICNVGKSPIELLENCEIQEEAFFCLTTSQFEIIRGAAWRYAEINDEIDLYFLRAGIQRIDSTTAPDSFLKHLSQQRTLGKYYVFERPEAPDKTRKLVSLGGHDAVISTWFTKVLDGLFGSEVSSHSYGYRFESSLSKANLFKPWFPQWMKYTTALSRIIEDGAYDNYWVVKLDIRSFYDQVSLTRLRVKLGTGPSQACGVILQSLDQEDRKSYETICATLIEWCRVIGESDRGVPQGPAFGRYLAELYLMQFDQDIEDLVLTHQAQYFRWVDDVFLIAPDQASAKKINQAVRSEIEALSLEVNEGKAFLGTVRDYRMRFHEYKSDSKYFVDQVTRNSRTTSTALNAQAREELDDMIDGPNGMGFRPENAAFFLTHLKTSPQAVVQFVPDLLKVEYARGSLFKHLFDYITKDLKECGFQPDKWDFSGLAGFRLEVFLNSLLWAVAEESLTLNASSNLSALLETLKSGAQSRLSKTLLIHIMLSDPNASERIRLDAHLSIEDLIQSIRQCSNSDIADTVLNQILDQLSSLTFEETIEILHALILNNNLTTGGYTRSADKFFAIVLEELNRAGGTLPILNCLAESSKGSGELLRKYHRLCCLSFVTASPKNEEELKRVWAALVSQTNNMEDWNPGRAHWLEKADSVEVNAANISLLFAAGVGGDGVCPGQADNHNIFDEYHYHLVVFLFALSNSSVTELPDKEELSKVAHKHGMLYLEWLLDSSGSVELYPNKKVCLRNLVENELTILKRGDELLVRYSAEPGSTSFPPLPKLLTSSDESSAHPFSNSVFEFPADTMSLDSLIQAAPNLACVIKLITQVFRNLCQMGDQYFMGATVPNVFLEGFGLLKESLLPAVPATALGGKLLVKEGSIFRSEKNDSGSSWNLLLERVETSERDLLPYSHHTQITATEIRTLLPPGAGIDDQVLFLEILGEALPSDLHITPFAVDHAKLEATAKYAQIVIDRNVGSTEKRMPTLFGKVAEVYLSITGERADFAKRLSFASVDSPSDKTLGGLLEAIISSLAWSAEHRYLGCEGVSLLASIESEFLSLAGFVITLDKVLDESARFDARCTLHSAKRARLNQGDDYELLLNGAEIISPSGEIVTKNNVTVIRCGGFSCSEESLKPKHSSDLRRSLVYFVEVEAKTILFLVDDIIRAVFEVIRKRSAVESYDSLDLFEIECLKDNSDVSLRLRKSPFFTKACEVILCNHVTSDQIQEVADSERFLLRWLEQFDSSEAFMLLEIIAAYQCITESDVKMFIGNVARYTSGSIVFSTKKTSDHGGLHRLLALTQDGQVMIRPLNLDGAVNEICLASGGDKNLVILTELILSGGQLEGNFKKHYLSTEGKDDEYIGKQRLFEIEALKGDFVQGMKSFGEIVIIAAAYTERGAMRVCDYLSKELNLPAECIKVKGALLDDSSCFFADTEEVTLASKKALSLLVSDVDRIESIFDIGNRGRYTKSLKHLNSSNLVVRPNSVTKRTLKIFTLPSKNKYIPPLFRETKEHY
ncbi:MAG: hypothetical protein ACI9SQ_000281 [Rubritalea sp.]|jgi:hypothetical protein